MPVIYLKQEVTPPHARKEMPEADEAPEDLYSSTLSECTPIYLPSDLTVVCLTQLHQPELEAEEGRLRLGQVYDVLSEIRTTVKDISILRQDKDKNARQQDANTRALGRVKRVEGQRDAWILVYNDCRRRLVNLGLITEDSKALRALSAKDCTRRSTHVTQKVGDSRRHDFHFYTLKNTNTTSEYLATSFSNSDGNDDTGVVQFTGTQQSNRRKKGTFDIVDSWTLRIHFSPAASPKKEDASITTPKKTKKKSNQSDGWIWMPCPTIEVSDSGEVTESGHDTFDTSDSARMGWELESEPVLSLIST